MGSYGDDVHQGSISFAKGVILVLVGAADAKLVEQRAPFDPLFRESDIYLDSMTKHQGLGIGVIGIGIMAADHVETITRAVSGARICAVADIDPKRAEYAASRVPGAKGIPIGRTPHRVARG